MDFSHSPAALDHVARVGAFIAAEIAPYEADLLRRAQHQPDGPAAVVQFLDRAKEKARSQGLWNLFLPDPEHGAGLSHRDYAAVAEVMGGSALAPEVFNCNAPDTGNAEVLLQFGSAEQRRDWLQPLLDGRIRSAFCMTEPDVASSDAASMAATARIEGDQVVLNGRKWWSTGVGHPHCRFVIFMGLTDPAAHRYARHSMVLVPLDTPGVRVERLLPTMGLWDHPGGHGEVSFTEVRLPAAAVIGGPGQAALIAQSRLGPGRVHHCMRLIGLAEQALRLACQRATSRIAFGKPLANLGGNAERIAQARIAIEQARLLVLKTAWLLDTQGLAGALCEVSQIKALVPRMTQDVVDLAIQLHGGAGLSDDLPLAAAWTNARALRLADGPDEVHLAVVARHQLRPYLAAASAGGPT